MHACDHLDPGQPPQGLVENQPKSVTRRKSTAAATVLSAAIKLQSHERSLRKETSQRPAWMPASWMMTPGPHHRPCKCAAVHGTRAGNVRSNLYLFSHFPTLMHDHLPIGMPYLPAHMDNLLPSERFLRFPCSLVKYFLFFEKALSEIFLTFRKQIAICLFGIIIAVPNGPRGLILSVPRYSNLYSRYVP